MLVSTTPTGGAAFLAAWWRPAAALPVTSGLVPESGTACVAVTNNADVIKLDQPDQAGPSAWAFKNVGRWPLSPAERQGKPQWATRCDLGGLMPDNQSLCVGVGQERKAIYLDRSLSPRTRSRKACRKAGGSPGAPTR